MEIKIVRALDEIEALKPAWDALLANTEDERLFCSFGWVTNAYKLRTDRSPLLLLVYAVGRLVGVFPFAVCGFNFRWFRYRALVHGASGHADYSSFLIAKDINERVAIARVVENLIELQKSDEWQLYVLDNLSEGDPRSSLFRELLTRETFGGSYRYEITPRVRLDRLYEDTKKVREIKRQFKKLQDNRTVTESIGVPLAEGVLERLRAVHSQRYPIAFFSSDRGQRFFAAAAQDSEFGRCIEVSCIEDGDVIVAAHFGFRCQGHVFYYVPMFNESYAQYGPGQYLLWRMLTHYRAAGCTEFDFLRGSESYKYQWMNGTSINASLLAVAPGASRWLKALVVMTLARDAIDGIFREV